MNKFQRLAYKAGKHDSKKEAFKHIKANVLGRNYYSLFKNKDKYPYEKCKDFVKWIME
ncbi:hypothetical protein ACQR2L_09750 [Clostridium butyricum]|uniref:hypothetical protein n=1 Tax=Clostridium butyricum TaxID=1492 RepID=UPI003D129850